MASISSALWKAIASRVALAMWALVVPRVIPTIVPALSGLGAPYWDPHARPGDVVEQPCELGSGEVGVEEEPGLAGKERFVARLSQSVTSGRGASVLPDDRVGERLAGRALPQERRLPLVGDADRRHVARGKAGIREDAGGHVPLRAPDLEGVVLHPPGLREDLAKFLL